MLRFAFQYMAGEKESACEASYFLNSRCRESFCQPLSDPSYLPLSQRYIFTAVQGEVSFCEGNGTRENPQQVRPYYVKPTLPHIARCHPLWLSYRAHRSLCSVLSLLHLFACVFYGLESSVRPSNATDTFTNNCYRSWIADRYPPPLGRTRRT